MIPEAQEVHEGDSLYFCPLLEQDITDWYCENVGYQASRAFKPTERILIAVMEQTKKTRKEVDRFCSSCPNYRLPG